MNLRNGAEEHIERMADAIDHGLAIEPCSNVTLLSLLVQKKMDCSGVQASSAADPQEASWLLSSISRGALQKFIFVFELINN